VQKIFEFEAILIKGPQNLIYIDFPFDAVKEFGIRKAIPVKVAFNGHEFEMNLLPKGKGKHWLHIKKDIRDLIGKNDGDTVSVKLGKNESPKIVDVPEYLQWLLEDDPEMMRKFKKLPYSARKFWVEHMEESKNKETKVERVNKFFDYIQRNYSG